MPTGTLILIHPPQLGLLEGFTAGLVSLAAFVSRENAHVEVELLDLGLSPEPDVKRVLSSAFRAALEPVWVGISTTTATYQSALGVARTAKELTPSCTVVLGGHHASAQADIILQNHRGVVDVIARGEGEIALTALTKGTSVGLVPGVSYWGPSGICHNPPAPLLTTEQLDLVPVTHRGEGMRSAPGKFDHATYVSARGCPLACHFCAVGQVKVRAKSIPVVVENLRAMVDGMGFNRIAIEDNFFAQSKARTLNLTRAISDSGLKFSWDCQTRVESCTPEIIRALRHSSCEAVYLGVEALTPVHLQYLGKTLNPTRYLQVLRHSVIPGLLREGVAGYLNLQLGIPGDTPDLQERTIRELACIGAAARRSRQHITVFPQLHVVYPGTYHFSVALRDGLFGPLGDAVFERFTAWEAEQQPVLRWLGRHFAHGTGGIPLGILDPAALRRGDFVVDPRRIMEVATAIRAFEEVEGIRVFHYGAHLAGASSRATLWERAG